MPRYCARLQLALLQNVEDNLVREQAELDLALCLAAGCGRTDHCRTERMWVLAGLKFEIEGRRWFLY